ncbi:MAG: hypothetical protein ACE5I3_08140 [Phycisphaerae bacterium]
MSRGTISVTVALCLVGGCPVDPALVDRDTDWTIPTDFDGIWRITSETGLANRCVTILGDRITQASECDSGFTLIADSEPSARSGNQIIWTFRTSEANGAVLHTISVFVQPDGTLRGKYSLRLPDSTFALTDRIIMERRRVRA